MFKRTIIALACIIGMASLAHAQMSAEDAQKLMEQRKAQKEAVATQPSTLTAGEVQALRDEIAQLKIENAKLKAQLFAAEAQIPPPAIAAPVPPAVAPNDPMAIAIKNHQIIKGMTEAQMRQSMTFQGNTIWSARDDQSESDGVISYVWHIERTDLHYETRTVTVEFKNGIVSHEEQTRDEKWDNEY